jgi:hypothetical protein
MLPAPPLDEVRIAPVIVIGPLSAGTYVGFPFGFEELAADPLLTLDVENAMRTTVFLLVHVNALVLSEIVAAGFTTAETVNPR